MDVKSLKGMAVISIASSQKIGSVGDVIIDSQEGRIGALKVESGGLLRKEHQYVPFEAVRSVGSDAVMIQDDSVLHDSFGERSTGYHNTGNMSHIRIVTESGVYIGHVVTAHFDEHDGRIDGWEFTPGGLGSVVKSNKVVDGRAIINIGEDLMIVPASAAEQRPAEKQAAEEQPAEQNMQGEPEPSA